MDQMIAVLTLIVLIALSLIAAADAVSRVVVPSRMKTAGTWQRPVTGIVAFGASALFVYRWVVVNDLMLMQAHVDGLLLIAALLGWTLFYLDFRSRMQALSAFGLPALFVFLLWAICALTFTFHPFDLTHDALVRVTHRVGVYVGSLFLVLAAIAGGTYLLTQHRLRQKKVEYDADNLPSLETTETLIIRSSAIGFALLTVGLFTGVIIHMVDEKLSPGWWYSTKVVLAVFMWLIYGLLTNVRHATSFRGGRAAWLAIIGVVLLLAVYGVVNGNAANHVQNTQPPEVPETPEVPQFPEATKSTANADELISLSLVTPRQEVTRCTS